MVGNPPAILGNAGSTSERIPHAAGQLCVTTPEPRLLSVCSRAHRSQLLSPCTLEPVLCNKRSYRNEKALHSNESSPHSLQLEKAAATKTQSSQKKNRLFLGKRTPNRKALMRNMLDMFE